METNFTPWNDRLEIEGDIREEIEREEANRDAPDVPIGRKRKSATSRHVLRDAGHHARTTAS